MALQSYLAQTRSVLSRALASRHPAAAVGPITVVMGNEACDLDSAACAIALAYGLNSAGPLAPAVPLLNIRRHELRLRPDVRLVIADWLGVSPDVLPFREDLPPDLATSGAAKRLRLALVDHNALRGPDIGLSACVVLVIDHHAREGAWPAGVDVTVEPVGSCSSLVANRLLGDPGTRALVTPELARALRAAVLLDTANLLPAAGKATPTDAAAIELLESLLVGAPAREAEFSGLLAARRDASGFEHGLDYLRRDVKTVRGVGAEGEGVAIAVAALTTTAAEFLRRVDAVESVAQFVSTDVPDCRALLLMGTEVNPEGAFRRDLAVLRCGASVSALGVVLSERLVQFLVEHSTPRLELQPAPLPEACGGGGSSGWRLFQQGNSRASRKQVLPAVLAFLAKDGDRA